MSLPLVGFHEIPRGDPGALATLAIMRNLVEHARGDRWAVLVAQSVIPAGTPDETVAALQDFFEERFLFQSDPAPMDRVASPILLLQELVSTGRVRGDCDDAAVLAAFLGVVRGLPYRFRAVGFRDPGPLTHVYTLLQTPAGLVPLDVTKNRNQVTPAARRVMDFP